MKIPDVIQKKLIQPKLILIVVFIALLVLEAYLLYYKVYGNLSTGIEDVSTDSSIVRLDLPGYKSTLQLLDANTSYVPSGLNLNNPFR